MWKAASRLAIDATQRRELLNLARSHEMSRRVVTRARIVLAAAAGGSNREVARRLGVSRPAVIQWRARFRERGVNALLHDAPRPGRPRRIPGGVVEAIVRATLETTPYPAGRWSIRTMAAAYGLSPSTVRRIWTARGLAPRIVASFLPAGAQDAS